MTQVANLFVCGVHEMGKTFHAKRLVGLDGTELCSSYGPTDPRWRRARNIGATLQAVLEGLEWCQTYHVHHVFIQYVFEGVEAWAMGVWRAKKTFTKEYVEEVAKYQRELTIQFNQIPKEEPTYVQLHRQCLVAIGVIKPEPEERPFFLQPFPEVDLASATEMLNRVHCPRCASVPGESPHEMRRTPLKLICPDCHHSIPNHQELSYERWCDCVNPACGAKRALRPYVMLGESQPVFALHCPFCYTTWTDQLLSEYWLRLWIEKADPFVRNLGEEVIEALFYDFMAAKRRYEDKEEDRAYSVLV